MDRNVRGVGDAVGRDSSRVCGGAVQRDASAKYFDDIWTVHHADGGEEYEIDFRTRFGNISSWQQRVAKNIVFLRCVESGGCFTVAYSPRTMISLYANLASIFHFMNERFGGRLFSNLSGEELTALVVHNTDGSLARHGTVFARVRVLAWMYDLRLTEHRLVPEEYLPAHDIGGRWESDCLKWVKEAGESAAEWKAGGSFDIVPFEVSLAILAYCLELVRTDETKYVLSWFQAERKLRDEGGLPGWKAASKVFSMFGEQSGDYAPRGQARYVDEVFFKELCKYYPEVHSRDQLPIPGCPFRMGTHSVKNSLNRKADHLLTACFISILILTGIRHSEASGMARNSFRKNGENYVFASNIDKTNHGVITNRQAVSANRVGARA